MRTEQVRQAKKMGLVNGWTDLNGHFGILAGNEGTIEYAAWNCRSEVLSANWQLYNTMNRQSEREIARVN